MTDITIVPAGARDKAMHEDQFKALQSALEGLGYEATVDIGIEQRSVPMDVVVYIALKLADHATDGAIHKITEAVKATLRNLRRLANGDKRHAVIFGPDDAVLAEIELEEDDDTDAAKLARYKTALEEAQLAFNEIAYATSWPTDLSGSPLAPLQNRAKRALTEIGVILANG